MRKTRSHTGRPTAGQRQLRVAEQVRHWLVEILQRGRFRDPALLEANTITVTAVEIGADLKHATAFVMPLGGANADTFLDALNRAAGFFRTELASRMELRYTPKITFKIDHSFDEAARIERLLQHETVRKDLLKRDDGDEEE
ncbi:MAG: 30S ribosome-binding factor RbfA [Alphaproteobacteria bacterium]|nr:30S ribosome-binding factor RbfA [Alphaproteobacteria bacterium]